MPCLLAQGQHLLSAVTEIISGAKTLGWDLHPRQRGDTSARPLVSVELGAKSLTAKQVHNTISSAISQSCSRIGVAVSRRKRIHLQDLQPASTWSCSTAVAPR